MNNSGCWLKKIWPLPPADKRKPLPFFVKSKALKTNLQIQNDGDYLFYQTGALIEKISILVFLICMVDVFTHTELLVDRFSLLNNKSTFIAAWGKIMGPLTFILSWLAYGRIRLVTNLERDHIPTFLSKEFFINSSKRMATQVTALIACIGLILLPIIIPNFAVEKDSALDKIFHLSGNLEASIFLGFLFAFLLGAFVTHSMSALLMCEKSIRFSSKPIFDQDVDQS